MCASEEPHALMHVSMCHAKKETNLEMSQWVQSGMVCEYIDVRRRSRKKRRSNHLFLSLHHLSFSRAPSRRTHNKFYALKNSTQKHIFKNLTQI